MLKIGDIVLFGKYSGTEVKVSVKSVDGKFKDEDRVIVKEDDILAVLPAEEPK
jgi:co-chaperonin GroES (HSP10)